VFASSGALTPLYWFFEVLSIAAFVAEAWALVDALRRPTKAFVAAGKQTKPIWLIILGVAAVIGLYSSTLASGLSAISILPIAAFVAAAIYLTDVRPKVRGFNGGGTSSGPYGPW
jgi:predicted membrane metal-binding protein